MKNKYQRLNKEEKRQARKDFKNSESNKIEIYQRLNRLKTIGIVGIIYSLITFGLDFLFKSTKWNFLLDGALLIFCLLTLIKSNEILVKQINKFLIEKASKEKRK